MIIYQKYFVSLQSLSKTKILDSRIKTKNNNDMILGFS